MFALEAFAYEVETHRALSAAAADAAAIADPVSDLGLKGIADPGQRFPDSMGKTARDLIRDGAKFEDNVPRPLTHFFDPVNNRPLTVGGVPLGRTSPDWALEDSGQITGFLTLGEQRFSFVDARGYLLNALTSAMERDRNVNFGLMFETLGHVIHHVQDMAQPQHVRNDAHLDLGVTVPGITNPSAYEKWTDRDGVRGALPFGGYAPTYSASDRTTFNAARNQWTTPDGKGMADFTNRNFVSAGTNFDRPGLFAAPDINTTTTSSADIQALCAGDGLTVPVFCENPNLTGQVFFIGTTVTDRLTGAAASNPFASTFSIFDPDLKNAGKNFVYTLNRFNFAAAHNFLIPRAVGYSAGTLNYFFRGKIDLVPDPADPARLLVKNLGPEPMKGTFQLYYDGKDEIRRAVPDGLGPVAWDTTVILAAAEGQLAAGGSMSVPAFSVPTNPPPKSSEYVLVFTGEMGAEKPMNPDQPQGAVVGKVVRGPTYGGALYVAGVDASGNVVSFKVDTGGVSILSGPDISKADANNPNGVLVTNGGKFDPLGRVYAVAKARGDELYTTPRAYTTKQVEFEETLLGIGHHWKNATFFVPTFPGLAVPFSDHFSYTPAILTNPFKGFIIWTAKSPDPTVGTFDFVLRGAFPLPQSPVISFTRRFVSGGEQRIEFGQFSLPALPSGYSGFFAMAPNTEPGILISPDGTKLSGFLKIGGTADRTRLEVRIQLAPTPTATLVTAAEFRQTVTSTGGEVTTTDDPAGCSVTGIDFNGNVVTGVGNRHTATTSPFEQTTHFEEVVPIAYIANRIATYTNVSDSHAQSQGTIAGCFAGTDDFVGTTNFGKIHVEQSASVSHAFSSSAETRMDGGSFTSTFVFAEVPVVNPSIQLLPLSAVNASFNYSYEGRPPAPPLEYTGTQFGPRISPVVTLSRPLTGRAADAISSSSAAEGVPFITSFRGRDITGKPYVADASPLGEVFFATADMSELVHEPLPNGMPMLTRNRIPANIVRLLAAVWL